MLAVSAKIWEEDDPGKICLSAAPAGHPSYFVSVDTEICELSVRQATQLTNCRAILAPVAETLDRVHFTTHIFQWCVRTHIRQSPLDGLLRHERDVSTANAEVGQFAVCQAAQLCDGFTIAAPVAVVSDQVHRSLVSSLVHFVFHSCKA